MQDDLDTLKAKGCVKSHQEGVVLQKSIQTRVNFGETKDYLIATISTVDSGKTIVASPVVVEREVNSGQGYSYEYPVVKDNGIYLRVSAGGSGGSISSEKVIYALSWKVIEFY